jgi:hypothetical protein
MHLIVKRYTFDNTQTEFKFQEIEDAINFWQDCLEDYATWGGVAIAWYKDGVLFDFR